MPFLWLFSHDGKVRNLNFNLKCAFWITQCTHDRSTCVFWITHYTHEWPKMWFSFRERGKDQTCTCVVLRFLCMYSARYYRWKWLEGHTSSAPQNTILRSSHSYTDFVAWFARILTGKHLCTVIWDAHFKLRFATWFGIHTVFFAYFEF